MNTAPFIAAAAILAGSSVALADTVTMAFEGTGQGRNVKFDLNGQRLNVFAGQLRHEVSGGTGLGASLQGEILTYCTDLLEHTVKQSRVFNVVDPKDAPASPMGNVRAGALRDLYAYAGGAQRDAGANRDFAAAFQLAVWEIVYDFDGGIGRSSLDIESGAFEAYRTNGSTLSSAIKGHLTTLFDAIGTIAPRQDGMGLFALVNDGAQDQLVELRVVPLPGAASLGFAGLFGLAGIRRRR